MKKHTTSEPKPTTGQKSTRTRCHAARTAATLPGIFCTIGSPAGNSAHTANTYGATKKQQANAHKAHHGRERQKTDKIHAESIKRNSGPNMKPADKTRTNSGRNRRTGKNDNRFQHFLLMKKFLSDFFPPPKIFRYTQGG